MGKISKSIRKFQRESQTECVIISFPKCGRTWLRIMLNKIIIDEYKIKKGDLLETFTLTKKIKEIPNINFTHDDEPHLKSFEEISTNKSKYANKKIIFLVRDPRDVIVSYYFQYTKRNDRKQANDNFDGTISEFLHHTTGRIDNILHFYNIWAKNRVIPKKFLIIRYEDLMSDSVYHMQRVLDFLTIPAKLKTIQNAVDFCNFDNMKKMEKSKKFGGRLSPKDENDNVSYKVRKGKIGGYTDYLTDEDIEFINKKIAHDLDDYFYYYK